MERIRRIQTWARLGYGAPIVGHDPDQAAAIGDQQHWPGRLRPYPNCQNNRQHPQEPRPPLPQRHKQPAQCQQRQYLQWRAWHGGYGPFPARNLAADKQNPARSCLNHPDCRLVQPERRGNRQNHGPRHHQQSHGGHSKQVGDQTIICNPVEVGGSKRRGGAARDQR